MNQGVTEVRNRYHSKAKEALIARANDLAARLGTIPNPFSRAPIDLRPSSAANNAAFYEAGNVCAVYYDAKNVPDTSQLSLHLQRILEAYSVISDADPDLSSLSIDEDDPSKGVFDEDHTRFRAHRRLERNPLVAKRVKLAQGFVCKACGFDFRKQYPGIARNEFIEAHHLVPIAQLKGQKVQRDPVKDFAVLCSNCHRMIHRTAEPHDLSTFRQALRKVEKEV